MTITPRISWRRFRETMSSRNATPAKASQWISRCSPTTGAGLAGCSDPTIRTSIQRRVRRSRIFSRFN
jgi:hypothetical protein